MAGRARLRARTNRKELIRTQRNELPLAARMRPKKLQDVIGQEHVIGRDKLLYRAIRADRLGSIILYGPPGTGKTSIANVIANETKGYFLQLNATTSGKKDMEAAIRDAKERQEQGQKTILFIDEIHRFNKAQQDYLLPFVESGLVVLVGATTENPYFEVNKALISRSCIFELKPLSEQDIQAAIERALSQDEQMASVALDDDAKLFLCQACSGDVRSALNALEIGALTTVPDASGTVRITLAVAQECVQKKALSYDKDGDQHYDVISAFIKSMRGSDPDAVLYYLARMLEAGEDVKFIARRIMIHACEDVGLADPMALVVATSAAQAVERVGMPEANLILADAAVYIACAPKSNTITAGISEAQELVRQTGSLPIPPHLKDSHYKDAKSLNRGIGYLYPHDFPNHYVKQQYLPDAVRDKWLYKPTHIGYEQAIANHMNRILRDEANRRKQNQERS